MDAEMASWKSTGIYVDEVPPPGVNIIDCMWIFRVKRLPRSPPAFKARYVAPPATADPSLFLRTDTSLPPFYVLVYVDDLVFATADTEALTLVKSELQKSHSCTNLGELRSYLGLQITRDRARRTITLTQSHLVHQVLQRFGFQFSSPQPTPLSTSHSLLAPPSDESVEQGGPYPKLVGCLMYLMTCTRLNLAYPLSLLARYVAPSRHRKVHRDAAKRVLHYLCSTLGIGLVLGGQGPVVLTGHADASWVHDSATQRSSQGYTFSLGSGSVSWRSTRSSSVLSSSCEAEIYDGAMAVQELRWLTYLLTDLEEQPRSPPVLYVDNKAMIALCQEHRLEHKMKHIALRYFLARELQQRGQLRLAYVATWANIANIFTKALPTDPDALDIPTPRSYAEAIAGEYFSKWQTSMDVEMASWKSIGSYVDEVPPPGANIVDGMWIFKVKRPRGSPPAFKARYVARGFSQRQGVDIFHTFSPTPKMTTLQVLLHVAAQRD
ncbi:unnamed protein product [Closterium sp. NIES-54]